MKNLRVKLLFIIVILSSACSTTGDASLCQSLQVNQGENTIRYKCTMVVGEDFVIKLVDYNFVIVSAPQGTKLTYTVNRGAVTVLGDLSETLMINLKKEAGPAELRISISECPKNECGTGIKVYFDHYVMP